MKFFIQFFSILLFLAGIFFIFYPEIIFGFIEGNSETQWMYLSAIVVRLILGVVLIISANTSKFPIGIKLLGYIIVIAAVIFIFIGRENFHEFISTVIPSFNPYGRFVGVLVMAFGSLLFYAFTDRKAKG